MQAGRVEVAGGGKARSAPASCRAPADVRPAVQPWRQPRGIVLGWVAALCWAFLVQFLARSQEINPPLGPYVNLKAEDFAGAASFTTNDRVVLTPYFYWYDIYSLAHILNSDGSDALTDHPPTLTGFSYLSRAWHKSQLRDMIAAGIDVLLPVYWGEPSQRLPNRPVSAQPWSYSGIPPLVEARAELLAEGAKPPAIGMFYDASTLQYNAANERIDLTTPRGRQWFYESIRDFFSLVPPKHWAQIANRPIVFLYSVDFAAKHDQTSLDYLREQFAADFNGRTPFVVREISWRVQADNVYAWGGALGLRNPGVASLGPGYDHSAVPGRAPLVIDREGGAFFERNWLRFLRNPSKLVFIETWNEYHEGTDIAASREYGRAYIELNRKYADLFRQGFRPPRPRGPYSDVKFVSVILEATNIVAGLEQTEQPDGATQPAQVGGRACRVAAPTVHPARYIYFRLDDSFKWADRMVADIDVEYFDGGRGSFWVEFDGSDPNAPFYGAYTASNLRVQLTGAQTWKTARFRVSDARFINSQNGGSDFRISVQAEPYYVRQVRVIRPGVPEEAGQPVAGGQEDFALALNPTWLTVGAQLPTFQQTNDLLRLRAPSDGTAYLAWAAPGSDTPNQEVLARLRVAGYQGTNFFLGGVAVAVDPQAGTGLNFGFQVTAQGQRQMGFNAPGLPPAPAAAFGWQTNTWYWLRLRHQPNRLTNFPDLLARLWLADGETAEPDTWLAWWDYYPASSARRGFAGLVAGKGGAAVLECDYFLAKVDGQPTITVRLPAPKPPRVVLRPLGYSTSGGFQFQLAGQAESSYLIEASTDLADWSGWPALTDSLGRVSLTDSEAAALPRRFYRARQAW